jgi:hypothetical protein
VGLDDLKFAHERGLKKIELHIDSNVVVQTLHSVKDESVVGLRIIQKNCCLLAMLGSKDLSFLS